MAPLGEEYYTPNCLMQLWCSQMDAVAVRGTAHLVILAWVYIIG